MELASNPRRYETFELFINAVEPARPGCGWSASTTPICSMPRRSRAGSRRSRRCCAASPTPPAGRPPVRCHRRRPALLSRVEPDRGADYPRDARIEAADRRDRAPGRDRTRRAHRRWSADLSRSSRARADAIAAALRARGVVAGDRVGLMLDRDLDLLPAMVGTLTAGATYVPLDPAFPPERLSLHDRGRAAARSSPRRIAAATARSVLAGSASLGSTARRAAPGLRRDWALVLAAAARPMPTSSTPRARPASPRACASRIAASSNFLPAWRASPACASATSRSR